MCYGLDHVSDHPGLHADRPAVFGQARVLRGRIMTVAGRPISSKSRTAIAHLVLILFSVAFLIPFLCLIATSLKTLPETVAQPPAWLPKSPQWHNYKEAWLWDSGRLGYVPFLYYLRNTIILCWLNVVGTVLSNAMAAYGFARLRW